MKDIRKGLGGILFPRVIGNEQDIMPARLEDQEGVDILTDEIIMLQDLETMEKKYPHLALKLQDKSRRENLNLPLLSTIVQIRDRLGLISNMHRWFVKTLEDGGRTYMCFSAARHRDVYTSTVPLYQFTIPGDDFFQKYN